MQRYVRRYKIAVAVVRKFIIGFMNRHKPKCDENIYVSVGTPFGNLPFGLDYPNIVYPNGQIA